VSEPTSQEDVARFHRGFAAMSNDRAWALSLLEPSPARDEEMLQASYASAWHWSQVGTVLNWARAALLLAEVHALLGNGEQAWVYAERVRLFFLEVESPKWEAALVQTVHAHAASAGGRAAEHRASYERAIAALAAIPDEEERSIVARTFALVPKPQ
jgi:hypothetical protein